MDDVTRADIKSGAIKGGSDKDGDDTLYICRKKMGDGVHPGKYSWKRVASKAFPVTVVSFQ